jgi:hypothetical protein
MMAQIKLHKNKMPFRTVVSNIEAPWYINILEELEQLRNYIQNQHNNNNQINLSNDLINLRKLNIKW